MISFAWGRKEKKETMMDQETQSFQILDSKRLMEGQFQIFKSSCWFVRLREKKT